jgi:hypothetical protein
MNINSRVLRAVLNMELAASHLTQLEQIFNCSAFSPLHYRVMTHKSKLEFRDDLSAK